MKKNLLFILIIASYSLSLDAQNQKNLKSGFSYGQVSEQASFHSGISINTGFEIIPSFDRIRFNPNFTIGYHQGNDDQFYPLQMETLVLFDLIRNANNSVNWLIGIGAYGNITFGVQMGSFGGYAGTGFRIKPENSSFSFEVMPINFMLGYGPRKEILGKISIIYRLESETTDK